MRFFVVGSGRCGTTLLRRMLDLHPALHVIDETHWIPILLARFGHATAAPDAMIDLVRRTRHVTGAPTTPLDEALSTELGTLPSEITVRPLVDRIATGLARRHGKLWVADKTPDYGPYMVALQALWPGALFVHLLRDGVAAAQSMARHPGYRAMRALDVTSWPEVALDWEAGQDLVPPEEAGAYLALWGRRISLTRAQAHRLRAGSYFEVRYEDLIADPMAVLRQVADHLRLPISDGWMAAAAALVDPLRAARARDVLPVPPGAGEGERALLDRLRNRRDWSVDTPRLAVLGLPGERHSPVQVFGCVRDEMLRLPDFLRHYRQLGVRQFFLVDNGSQDGTTSYLREQPDVALFATTASYGSAGCGVDWMNELLEEESIDRWALIVDIDELLVYPHCEAVPLAALVDHLDQTGSSAMATPLLDMYGRGPIATTLYEAGGSLIEACPFFDPVQSSGARQSPVGLRGGPRERLFWRDRDRIHAAPVLHKTSLVRWRPGLRLDKSTHRIDGVQLAETTGALLHFKFLADFPRRAALEAARGEHFGGARQYAVYREVFTESPDLEAWSGTSIHYRDSSQLVELGVLRVGAGFPLPPAAGGEGGRWLQR